MDNILPVNQHPYQPIPDDKKCSSLSCFIITITIATCLVAVSILVLNWIFLYEPLLLYRDDIAHLFSLAKEFAVLIDSVKKELKEISLFINTTLPVVHQMHDLLCRIDPQECPSSAPL